MSSTIQVPPGYVVILDELFADRAAYGSPYRLIMA
jgi:hypothetical protein